MSETKTSETACPLPERFILSPETGQTLNDWVMANGFRLFGHGTGAHDPQSFFDKGVTTQGDIISSPSENIMSIALPIGVYADPDEPNQITNVDFMSDWPHKKYSLHPNVVILAVPNAKPEEGIYVRNLIERLIDIDEGDKGFPAELIVGFFESATKEILRNPGLSLTPATLEKYYGVVRRRVQETNRRLEAQLTSLIVQPPAQDIPSSKANADDEYPVGDIW